MLTIGGDAMPAVAGVLGSKSRLSVTRLYTSSTTLSTPLKSTRSVPMLVDLFDSHFKSGLPSDACRKPGWMVVLEPVMS